MQSSNVNAGDNALASQYNNLRDDAQAAGYLRARQQGSPDMTLYVEAGMGHIGNVVVNFAGGNSPTFSAPSGNQRIDLLVMDSRGVLSIVQGTEDAHLNIPTYPAGKIVICEVFNRVGETSIKTSDDSTNGYIYKDSRPFVAPVFINRDRQVSGSATIDLDKTKDSATRQALTNGNQTIDGYKYFSTTPKVVASDPTDDNHLARKAYVDGLSTLIPMVARENITIGQAVGCVRVLACKKSTYVDADNPTTNYDGTGLVVGGNGSNPDKRRTLIEFDLSNFSTIGLVSAVLYMNCSNIFNGSAPSIYRADASWAESTATWNNKPAPTGLRLDNINMASTGWTTVTLTTAVQNWLDGTWTNNGMIIYDAVDGAGSADPGSFYDDEAAANVRPYLLLTYSNEVALASADGQGEGANGFIGFAQSAVSAGSSVYVKIVGSEANQSGLTIGAIYYLSNTAGAIATSAGANSKKVGIAISATKLLILNMI